MKQVTRVIDLTGLHRPAVLILLEANCVLIEAGCCDLQHQRLPPGAGGVREHRPHGTAAFTRPLMQLVADHARNVLPVVGARDRRDPTQPGTRNARHQNLLIEALSDQRQRRRALTHRSRRTEHQIRLIVARSGTNNQRRRLTITDKHEEADRRRELRLPLVFRDTSERPPILPGAVRANSEQLKQQPFLPIKQAKRLTDPGALSVNAMSLNPLDYLKPLGFTRQAHIHRPRQRRPARYESTH